MEAMIMPCQLCDKIIQSTLRDTMDFNIDVCRDHLLNGHELLQKYRQKVHKLKIEMHKEIGKSYKQSTKSTDA
jgi:hypothetical protein